MHRLATLSLNNRAFIALVCVVVAIVGAMSMTMLRQELIPSVSLPQIQVVTTSPGASSEQVKDRISDPIENGVRGLENVEGTSSTSQSSLSMVTVELTYGTDMARSSNQVEAAISRIEDQLPEGAEPQVIAGGTGDIPAAVLSISSDLDPSTLADRLNSSVVPELERIEGVSGVIVVGAPPQIVKITPDEQALAERGLSTGSITEALDANGLSIPGGTVVDGDQSLDVTIGVPLESLEALETMVLMPPEGADVDPTQAPTTLADVATVEQTQQEATSISRTNGRESLVMVINTTVDGNVVDVSENVTAELDSLLPSVGGAAESQVVFDQAPFIQESILALAEEGLLGLLFAIAVILVFLRAVRPTVVTAISIPMSLLMAFVGMLLSDYTLNMLTLAALTISIGRVVDDSIVVIENITRHLTYGKTRRRAIIDGVREVAGAITASTLATVVVFLPVAVVSGWAGELLRPFSLTVAIAMLSSLVVALTIVPVLAYWFLRPPRAAQDLDPDDEHAVAEVRDAAEAKEERGWLHRMYSPTLAWSLRHRFLALLAAVAILGGTVALYPLLKINILGDTGQNIASYTQTLPAGTTLEESSAKAMDAEEALGALDGVDVVQTTIGGSQFGFGGASNEITYQVTTDSEADQEALREQMLTTLQDLPEAGEIEDSFDAGAIGSSTVDILVTGPTPEDREQAVDLIIAELDPLPDSVEEVSTDLEGEQPTAVITVNRQAAAQRGLTEEAVVGLVAQQLFPAAIGQVTIGDAELDIFVEQGEGIETLQELQDMQIAGFPVTDVATIEETLERPMIRSQNSLETVTVSLTPAASDDVGATADAARQAISAVDLPEGVQASTGGAAEDIETIFGQLVLALVVAILLTYVLLVWIFKSLIQPLILLVSIPFAATGSLGLLVLTGVPLGLPSMIGMLMLVGIVVTNAIVLIDLVNQYRRDGMTLDEGLMTGAQKRLRPILMTSAATIFALIPMALGITGSAGFIAQPLAVVVIGGLVSSTLLTLIIVPVLYRIAEGPGEKRRIRDEARDEERRIERERRADERAGRDGARESRGDGYAAGTRSTAPSTLTAPASSAASSAVPSDAVAPADAHVDRDLGTAPSRSVTPVTPGTSPSRSVTPGTVERGHTATRRRSLKERGGIVGIVKRRLGRN